MPIVGDMSPHIKWQRSKTIARGAACCDFCLLPVKGQQEIYRISKKESEK